MNIDGKYYDVCQSCGMLLKSDKDRGTNADGSLNYEFCFKCYKEGAFLDPNITMHEMIKGCIEIMKQFGMPEDKATGLMHNTIPNLKRWKK